MLRRQCLQVNFRFSRVTHGLRTEALWMTSNKSERVVKKRASQRRLNQQFVDWKSQRTISLWNDPLQLYQLI